MRHRSRFIFTFTALVALGLLGARPGASQQGTLTLADALARARTRAPAILAARTRVDEARGRLEGASVLLRDNPVVEGAAGPRRAPGGNTSVDHDVGITQSVELGGRRGARIAGARAGIDREQANVEEATRRLVREVATTFARALAAEEGVRLARVAADLATALGRSTERRFKVGDIPELDVNVARVAAARAVSDVRAAEASGVAVLGELRLALGMDAAEPLTVAGDLHDRRPPELEPLLSRAVERADLRSLAAEAREAETDVRLGKGFAWPDVALGVHQKREEGDDIVLGGLSVTVPLFARGQELRATGTARARRLRIELAAARRAVEVEVRTAFDAYHHRLLAVDELERNALPHLTDNEGLARRSYDAGQLGLSELLLVRRQILETRAAYLDRLLDAALARVELEASAGVLE